MLTERQLADIQADVTETLTNPKADPSMRLLARHCQYMLDELAARTAEDAGRYNAEWLKRNNEQA